MALFFTVLCCHGDMRRCISLMHHVSMYGVHELLLLETEATPEPQT